MIIFPNKILLFTYGTYYASFVPSEYAETSLYRTYYDAEMNTYEVTTYPEKTIQEVYPLTLSSDSHLNKELPTKNIEYIHDDEVSVEYKWESPTQLTINLYYPGGITQMEFKESPNYTHVTTHHSPD
ncbi:MAG: hypothetical protein LIP01_06205 [Tannerellaceae bacterium]|nr:hypothetical protein [Tannerellaceae bacterium]